MATVGGNDDIITATEAGAVDEARGADGTSPLPLVDDNENNEGDPPAYPGSNGQPQWGQEMTVMGRSAPVVTEPSVTFVAKDDTSASWSSETYTYSLPLSSSVALVYSTFAKDVGEMCECV